MDTSGPGQPASPDPVSVEQVLTTIQSALAIDFATRSHAERLLKTWEADAAPGFLLSLLRIVEQHAAVPVVGRPGLAGCLSVARLEQCRVMLGC